MATILVVATGVGAATTLMIGINQSAEAAIRLPANSAQAPTVVSGDNIYIAWWTNNTKTTMKK